MTILSWWRWYRDHEIDSDGGYGGRQWYCKKNPCPYCTSEAPR